MNIALLSDIHLESRSYQVNQVVLNTDVIVLAGDIAPGTRGLEWACDLVQQTHAEILYLCGNHEFYHNDIHQLRAEMKALCEILPMGPKGNRIHLLDDNEVIIRNVRFLGSTLWTDFMLFGWESQQSCMMDASLYLNDFRLIRNETGNFCPQDSIELHRKSVTFLERKLKFEKFDGSTVVITHHAPSYGSVVARYATDPISAAFASRLDHLLGYSRYWLHGHMHDSLDYQVNETRVVCNPRGYGRRGGQQENSNFNSALILEVD